MLSRSTQSLSRDYRGISLVEVLIAISIVGILSAIAYPVFIDAKRRGAIAHSISNLKQIHVALSLYREEIRGGTAPSGGDETTSLGLPPSLANLNLPLSVLRTGGQPSGTSPGVYTYVVLIPERDRKSFPEETQYMNAWKDYVKDVGERAVVLVDETQGSVPNSSKAFRTTRTAIGLRLEGSVETKSMRGILSSLENWK